MSISPLILLGMWRGTNITNSTIFCVVRYEQCDGRTDGQLHTKLYRYIGSNNHILLPKIHILTLKMYKIYHQKLQWREGFILNFHIRIKQSQFGAENVCVLPLKMHTFYHWKPWVKRGGLCLIFIWCHTITFCCKNVHSLLPQIYKFYHQKYTHFTTENIRFSNENVHILPPKIFMFYCQTFTHFTTDNVHILSMKMYIF